MSEKARHTGLRERPPELQTHRRQRYLLAMVPIGLAAAVLLYLISQANYPLFHSIVDMGTAFVAGSVFLAVWSGRRRLDNHYYLLIAIAFLAFALLDFMHLIGNKGMGVFPQYGNLGPTFYIASSYVLGVSFLLAPLFIRRKVSPVPALAVYLLVVALVLLSALYWRNFPTTYIEGTGLTAFKVYSDYAVCLMLLGGLAMLVLNRRAFDARVLRIISLSLVFSIATGLAFTLYADPFGIANAAGHFFQIASFYLIYLGFVETVLTKPQDILYRNLKQSNDSVLRLNSELANLNLSLSQDIAARQEAEEAVRASERRHREIVETAEEGIALHEPDGTITYVNQRMADMMGYSREEIVGRSSLDFIDEQERPAVIAARESQKDKGSVSVERRLRRKDGSLLWTLSNISPRRDVAGALVGYLAMHTDITERKEAEDQLRRANDGLAQAAKDLARSNEDLQQFASVASHDLQEPLRMVKGFLKLLEERYEPQLDAKAREYIGYAVDGATRMSQLIHDLLEYSRAGRAGKELEPTDAGRSLAGAMANLRTAIEEAGAAVTHDPLPTVLGDHSQLTQLFQNLVGNAIKFRSPDRPCQVHVGTQRQGKQWVFRVQDNGIGIPNEAFDRVFVIFQRLHTRDKYPGTGIGLAVCKKIVDNHGGRIWVESEPGKGSAFCFALSGA